MIPRLGEKYDIEIKIISKPRQEYQTDEYRALGLPVAPAIVVDEKIVTEGSDVSQDKLEQAICRQLGLPEPRVKRKKLVDRLVKH